MSEPARPFFIPMIGIVALFAALGPASRRGDVHSPFRGLQADDHA